MSTTTSTPPATRRIARSYLTDFIAAAPLPSDFEQLPAALVARLVDQLLDRAIQVRHVLRSDQLVFTFDLADDPAGWTTTKSAADSDAHAVPAADLGQIPDCGCPHGDLPGHVCPENREYPGQPGEHA